MSDVTPYHPPTSETVESATPPGAVAFTSAGYLTVADVKGAFRLAASKGQPLRMVSMGIGLLIALFFAIMGLATLPDDFTAGLIILTVALSLPLLVVVRLGVRHWRLASAARRRLGTFGHLEAAYAETGIHTQAPTGQEFMPWSEFRAVLASDRVAILRQRHSARFYIAAKSTLQEPERWEEFVGYLREQVT